MTITIDQPATLDALRAAATRTSALLASVDKPSQTVRGLTWTVSELAAHIRGDVQHYTGFVTGDRDARDYLDDMGEASTPAERSVVGNARLLREFGERDLHTLAAGLAHDIDRFAAACTARPEDEAILTETGLRMTPSQMACALLGEQLVHGLDIARTVRAPWPVPRRDALLVVDGVMAMVPSYVDPEASANVRASYELRFRGGRRYRLVVDRGSASVEPAGEPVDCWLSIDPVAFLLVGYGRAGQWSQVLRGKMLAGGRRPWLSMQFGNLLTSI